MHEYIRVMYQMMLLVCFDFKTLKQPTNNLIEYMLECTLLHPSKVIHETLDVETHQRLMKKPLTKKVNYIKYEYYICHV